MEYRRGRIAREYRRWGRLARLARSGLGATHVTHDDEGRKPARFPNSAKHGEEELSLDNAFALIERHPALGFGACAFQNYVRIRKNKNMTIETSYFLGAGASKAFYRTLPLASEMTLEYLLDLRGLPIGFDQAIARVEQYMVNQCWHKEKRLNTFEEIYSEFPENLDPLCPRENLECCLFEKLRLPDHIGARGLDAWVDECLERGHPILTTNYDTTVEWEIENHPGWLGSGDSGLLNYGIPEHLCLPLPSVGCRLDGRSNKLLLLKLYGSIGWSRCRECGKYHLARIYQRGARDAVIGRGKCLGCGGTSRSAVFVPLAVGEKDPNDMALKAIWEEAEQVLRGSRKIVFAGFSLNPSDQKIRELLERASSAGQTFNVTVVLDGNHPEILARYREVYGERVELYRLGWVKYLQERSTGHPFRY